MLMVASFAKVMRTQPSAHQGYGNPRLSMISHALIAKQRGGAGNIGHEHKPKPTSATTSGDTTGAAGSTAPAPPKSKIVVPQTATLPEVDDFHCGVSLVITKMR